MADEFSFLTDSDDDRAVEDLLSQALDHSVLEQIAAINCSSFSSDNLPSHLESRFRKLKSLPTTSTGAGASSRFPLSKSKSLRPRSADVSNLDERQIPDMKKVFESPSKSTKTPKSELEKKKLKSKSGTGSGSSDSESDVDLKSKSKSSSTKTPNKLEKKGLKSRSGTDSSGSWTLSSPESRTPSPPPARRTGCLWWSPKKGKSVWRKRGKENSGSSSLSWGDDIEFSMKEQKKMMKKAMKEEEKINREAEKIVKWAKQASDRMMDVSGLPDELSDFDDAK